MEAATAPAAASGVKSKTIADLLPLAAREHAAKRAILYKDESGEWVGRTYAEVGETVKSLATIGPGDFFGEIAAITGSPRTANVVTEEFTEVLEIPAATLRELRGVPEMDHLINLKLSERLTRTANADLVRLAGLDQRDLRDLRRRRRGPGEAPDTTNPEPSTA